MGQVRMAITEIINHTDYWDDNDGQVRMAITEIINHPDYNSATTDQDFALLRMADRINWAANPNIRPACLPEYTAGDYDQWMSTVTGWGTTSSGGSTSNLLLEVDVQVISNSECNAAYGGITDNMLCAQDASGNGGSDACQGDSGGPLVSCGADGNCGTTPGQNYELIGVVSFGIGCAEKDFPGVYARTTAALDWIHTNAMPFEACSRGTTTTTTTEGNNCPASVDTPYTLMAADTPCTNENPAIDNAGGNGTMPRCRRAATLIRSAMTLSSST